MLFDDVWVRGGKDLFEENLAQFGGADFVRSFNESARPTAEYLSGMDALSADVASRAYLTASGPFAGRADNLPAPTAATPSTAYRQGIERLYRRLLFRDASSQELQQSYRFLQSIYQAQSALGAQSYDLRFELDAHDGQGQSTTREIGMQVLNDGYGLGQTLINENDTSTASADGKNAQHVLDGPFTFHPNDAGQKVTISSADTHGDVIVSGLQIRGPLPDGPTRLIPVKDAGVQVQGAWRMSYDNGVTCYEDDNQNKGASSLVFPISVSAEGRYELTLQRRMRTATTRKRRGRSVFVGDYADDMIVEVQSHDRHRLAMPPTLPPPPKGEAEFTIDESDDTVPFRDLQTAFLFGPGDGVEISNADTHQDVVADAVRFTPQASNGLAMAAAGGRAFMVQSRDAVGQDRWREYQKSEYIFYKPVGRIVTDQGDSALKGTLSLLYKPERAGAAWKPGTYYRVALGYPGEARNDTDVPIIVHARASSPILRVSFPGRAHVGAAVTLDAGGSYDLQGAALQVTWRQIDGPSMKLSDPHSLRPTFTAPTLTAGQAGWEGLCRALMKHPDFLFTRPLALALTRDATTRRRLQLVKIAQDLVGRPPTQAEVAKVDGGAPLSSLVETYLASNEFADFYFRRIRLYQ